MKINQIFDSFNLQEDEVWTNIFSRFGYGNLFVGRVLSYHNNVNDEDDPWVDQRERGLI